MYGSYAMAQEINSMMDAAMATEVLPTIALVVASSPPAR